MVSKDYSTSQLAVRRSATNSNSQYLEKKTFSRPQPRTIFQYKSETQVSSSNILTDVSYVSYHIIRRTLDNSKSYFYTDDE